MASMIGQMFAAEAQNTPEANIMNQLRQLQQTFRGNPVQQVPMMLRQAGVPDAAIRQCMAQATEMMKTFGGRNR
jgi:hypothetical protein